MSYYDYYGGVPAAAKGVLEWAVVSRWDVEIGRSICVENVVCYG